MKLGLAQIEIEATRVGANRERAAEAVREAATQGCDLVCLPELFTVGYFAFDSYQREAESLDGATISQFQEIAREAEVAILAGTIVEDLEESANKGFETPAEDGLANTAVYIDAEGNRRAVYRKRHLFGYQSAEQELLTPGESVPTVTEQDFTIGITTCYDLRFPELYRQLVDNGVTLTLVPSAWPYPRVEHWKLFPQARAVENLMYVAGANGVGEFDETSLVGRSAVYDPWGTAVASGGEQSGVVTATVDPDAVSQRRSEFPALDDRRT